MSTNVRKGFEKVAAMYLKAGDVIILGDRKFFTILEIEDCTPLLKLQILMHGDAEVRKTTISSYQLVQMMERT